MTHKYKLGDYVEYYASSYANGDKVQYMDLRKGFISCIEERMQEDGSVVARYMIGLYIGAYGYMVSEEAIVKKLKMPAYTSRLEYINATIRRNETMIRQLTDYNRKLRSEIMKLEEAQKQKKEQSNE